MSNGKKSLFVYTIIFWFSLVHIYAFQKLRRHLSYRAFHWFVPAEFNYWWWFGFRLEPIFNNAPDAFKMMLGLKVVKIDSKISNFILLFPQWLHLQNCMNYIQLMYKEWLVFEKLKNQKHLNFAKILLFSSSLKKQALPVKSSMIRWWFWCCRLGMLKFVWLQLSLVSGIEMESDSPHLEFKNILLCIKKHLPKKLERILKFS